jgi:hypothetical protein
MNNMNKINMNSSFISGNSNNNNSINQNNTNESYIPNKTTFLQSQNGNGMQIIGTFARRQGQMQMDLVFNNLSQQPLSGFSIQFNNNSFGITPSNLLNINGQLNPNDSIETVLSLNKNGPVQQTTPINNLQIVVKNNTGIYYFQTLLPIHILFTESGKLEQDEWFKYWRDDSLNEYKYNIANLNKYADIKEMVDKLQINNIFCIAERYINNMNVLYLSVKLEQNIVFVMEMLVDQSLRNVKLSTKTAAVSLVNPFHSAIEDILIS